MGDRIERLLGRGPRSKEQECLGEDMAPSPMALAERYSALTTEKTSTTASDQDGPFSSSVQAPVRDFVG